MGEGGPSRKSAWLPAASASPAAGKLSQSMSGGVGMGEVLVGCDWMVRLVVVERLCCCVDVLCVLLLMVVPFPTKLALA